MCTRTLVRCEQTVWERLTRPWLWIISGLIESAEGLGKSFKQWRRRLMAGPPPDCLLIVYRCTRTRSPHPPP